MLKGYKMYKLTMCDSSNALFVLIACPVDHQNCKKQLKVTQTEKEGQKHVPHSLVRVTIPIHGDDIKMMKSCK